MVMDVQPAVEPVHDDPRTAPSLVFELFAVEGDVEHELATYTAERAQSLLDAGVATGANVFRLREQEVPGSPLARGVEGRLPPGYPERLMLFREEPGPAKRLPDAVFAAAYQLASDDHAAAEEAARGHAAAGGPGRRTISLGVFTKIIDWGRPNPVGDSALQSSMIVVTHPTDIGYVDEFNDWYSSNHMIDAAKSPPYRAVTRYKLARLTEGIPLPYLAIYEIEAAYSERLLPDMLHQVGVRPWVQRERSPANTAGQPVLTIDFWGFYERSWAGGEPRA